MNAEEPPPRGELDGTDQHVSFGAFHWNNKRQNAQPGQDKDQVLEAGKDQRYFESVLFGLAQEDAATARSLACELSHLFILGQTRNKF